MGEYYLMSSVMKAKLSTWLLINFYINFVSSPKETLPFKSKVFWLLLLSILWKWLAISNDNRLPSISLLSSVEFELITDSVPGVIFHLRILLAYQQTNPPRKLPRRQVCQIFRSWVYLDDDVEFFGPVMVTWVKNDGWNDGHMLLVLWISHLLEE